MTGQDTRSAVAAKPSLLDEIRARSEAVLYDALARFGSLADVSRGGTAELARDVLTVLAECDRLREQLVEIQTWFQSERWRGTPDSGSFGGHPYTDVERELGYGSHRDPRFLPAALRVVEQDDE